MRKRGMATNALGGQGEVVYVTIGRSEPLAPIAMTKLMVLDLRTGTTTAVDERYGGAFELRLTGGGIMVWRAEDNLPVRGARARGRGGDLPAPPLLQRP